MVAAGVNVNQQGASYIIGKDDTTYYAVKASTGAIAYSGTVFATVMTSVFGQLTSGGKVVIKAGTYTLATGISVPASVEVVGESRRSTIIQTSAAISAITMAGNNAALRNLHIDGNSAGTIGLVCTSRSFCEFEGLRISGFTSHGVDINGCVYLKFSFCDIQSNGGNGVDVSGASTTIKILDCYIHTNTGWGIYVIDGAGGCRFDGTICETNGSGGASLYVSNSRLHNMWFEDNTGYGLSLTGNTISVVASNFHGQATGIYVNSVTASSIAACSFADTSTNDIELTTNAYDNDIHQCLWDAGVTDGRADGRNRHWYKMWVQPTKIRLPSSSAYATWLTTAATAERTITLPDVTGTLAALNLAQTFSATQTFTDSIILSGNGKYLKLPSMTTANKTAAATAGVGALIWCTDATAGQELQCSDGSAWKYITLTALS